ncbi:MAG: archease [Actinobacteria bacterium]|nr:archease [Actinomycetota bacterium]
MLNNFNVYDYRKYEVIEHLSDVMLKVYGRSIKELFENAAEGMFSLITDINNIKKTIIKKIDIVIKENMQAEDLLIIWLEKLLFLNETSNLIFSDFKIINFINDDNESKINAVLKGEKINLKKHEIFLQIKAPTYHNLEIINDSNTGIFCTEIVFDV